MAPIARDALILEPIADDPEVGRWLAALEDGRRDTLTELERVTDEMLDARPEPLLDSIGTLLYHIALIETSWLLDDIFEGDSGPPWIGMEIPEPDRDASGRLTVRAGEPKERHIERLSRIRGYLIERLRPMTNDDFHRPRRLERYDAAPDWVLHHLLQHEAEHRSHIAYVRDRLLAGRGPAD